jgi:hypothetical protein
MVTTGRVVGSAQAFGSPSMLGIRQDAEPQGEPGDGQEETGKHESSYSVVH